jgi:hypothetical protein
MKMKFEFETTAWKVECQETAIVIRLENPPKHVKQAAQIYLTKDPDCEIATVSVTISESF